MEITVHYVETRHLPCGEATFEATTTVLGHYLVGSMNAIVEAATVAFTAAEQGTMPKTKSLPPSG